MQLPLATSTDRIIAQGFEGLKEVARILSGNKAEFPFSRQLECTCVPASGPTWVGRTARAAPR